MNQTQYSSKTRITSLHLTKYHSKLDQILETIQSPQHIPSNIRTKSKILTELLPIQSTCDQTKTSYRSQTHLFSKYLGSPSSSRSRVYSKRGEASQHSIKSSIQNDQFIQLEMQYMEQINTSNVKQAYQQLQSMMIVSVEQDNIHLLLVLLKLTALTFITFQEWSKALIFLNHCIFISEYTRNFHVIQWTFQQMGYICKYMKNYDNAKRFFKKCLEFAWFNKDHDSELQCYDELGKLCYLQCQLDHANFLHEKSVAGRLEPNESPRKEISKKSIQSLINSYPQQQEFIGQAILSKTTNFPFKVVQAKSTYSNKIKNEYLLNSKLQCIPSERLTFCFCPIDEMIEQTFMSKYFSIEIDLPIQINTPQNPQTERKQEKHLKLYINQKSKSKQHTLPEGARLDSSQKKQSLEQIINNRLAIKIDGSYQPRIQCINPSNLTHIRLSNDNSHQKIHTKKGLMNYTNRILNSTNNKLNKSNRSIPTSLVLENILF